MGNPGLIERAQELTDLELALLVSLVSGQHCLIEAEEEALNSLQKEIILIAANVFRLPYAVVEFSTSTTLKQFSNGILIDKKANEGLSDRTSEAKRDSTQNFPPDDEKLPSNGEQAAPWEDDGSLRIASIIILRDLDLAEEDVQIQALELLRTKRISTPTTSYSTSKEFLMVFIQNSSGPPLVKHLNDHIFISYHHDIEDEFTNLEESLDGADDDRASLSSVVHHHFVTQDHPKQGNKRAIFPAEDITKLTHLSDQVTIAAEVKAYLQNIVTFLRLHRAVEGGISPRATRHFDQLVKCLAPLHQLDYVTPSIVALAARKIYPHRIVITAPENERSMQYGSQLAAVTALLDGLTPEQIIEEVIESVEAPL